MLRLPDGMRDCIKAAAAENNRSMNAEIVSTLEEKYPTLTLDDRLQQAGAKLIDIIEKLPPDDKITARDLDVTLKPAYEMVKKLEMQKKKKAEAQAE